VRRYLARPAGQDVFGLGEGPVWDVPRERVLWVDVNAGLVLEGGFDGRGITVSRRHHLDLSVGAVAVAPDGRLLVAGRRRLLVLHADGSVVGGPEIIPPGTASRLNDGGCDPAGRFLVGGMALDDRVGAEVLVRLEHDATITTVDDDLTLSNGLGWSPDGRTLYSIDSVPGIIWSRGYDPDDRTGRRRPFAQFHDGTPDGLCLDREGNLWVAVWGRGEVRCLTPSGEHVATVSVAAPNTSSVAFVGPGLDTLLITTAREQLTDDQIRAHPLSGHLFLADVEATGHPVAAWSGHLPAPS
jgi:sugar lactone lactonase YvrE